MFHFLAVSSLSLLSIFAGTSYVGVWRGVIETRKMTWDEIKQGHLQQQIHIWFALGLLALMLITFIVAPVPWYFTVAAIAVFLAHHVSLRGIAIPNPRVRTFCKWMLAIAEFLYLVFLAFGV